MSTSRLVLCLGVFLFLTGAAFVVHSNTLPRVSDPAKLDAISAELGALARQGGDAARMAGERWRAARAELTTDKDLFFDIGGTLMVVGLFAGATGLAMQQRDATSLSRRRLAWLFVLAYVGLAVALALGIGMGRAATATPPWEYAGGASAIETLMLAFVAFVPAALMALWPLWLRTGFARIVSFLQWPVALGFVAAAVFATGQPTFVVIPFALALAYVALSARDLSMRTVHA